MSKRRGLGRGLDALLEKPSAVPETELALDRLIPNPNQPRRDFDEGALDELAASIRQQGVLQPLLVAPDSDGRYHILAGERRFRAAQKAGLRRVPVLVREVDGERQRLEIALVENLQRDDLNPVEEALAFERLRVEFELSQEEIATRVAKARSTVANSLRLLRLTEDALAAVRDGRLTAGQARPLLAVEDPELQAQLARQAIDEEWSAREVERRVRRPTLPAEPTAKPVEAVDVHARAAEERLTRRLQTRVEIRRRSTGKGTIRIHFHSEEELMRLFDDLSKTRSGDVQG